MNAILLNKTRRSFPTFQIVAAGLLISAVQMFPQSPTAVVGWGRNDHGQITAPASLTNALLVVTGYDHNLALRSDRTVLAWGADSAHQTSVPSGLSNVVALSAGQFHSLAVKKDTKDSTVIAWGGNFDGQTNVPSGLSNVVAVAAGGQHSLALKLQTKQQWLDYWEVVAGGQHSLALKQGGTVVGWGDNSFGQATSPKGLTNITAISAGRFHSLALKDDSTVVSWGRVWNGTNFIEVAPPPGLTNVTKIAVGHFHCLALKADGTVVAWGDDSLGQSSPPPGLSNVVAIAGGGYHSLALKADGTVVGWGNNFWGQTNAPSGFSGLRAITAGTEHSLAIQTPIAPRIVLPPQDQTVTSGRSATFTVFATGSAPIIYQWFKDDEAMTGATNPVFVISGVKFSDAGVYRLKLGNSAGETNISASLTVGPLFRIVSTNSSGGTVRITIRLTSAGNENATGFSVAFGTNVLRFVDASLGADATKGFLNINRNQAASGKVGLAIALAANAAFAAGDLELAVLSFQVVDVSVSRVMDITFEDTPIARQVADADANSLAGEFKGGTLSISSGVEGDVDGDGKVTATDVTRIGRIAARLDTTGLTSSILQRADCAPLLTGGDGKVNINDWVQAARFAVGLDLPRDATGPAPTSLQSLGNGGEGPALAPLALMSIAKPELKVMNITSSPGKTSEVVVRLQAKGQENALGFTLDFNPNHLSFIAAEAGTLPGNGVFLVNPDESSSGKLGIFLALPAGASFPVGTYDIVRVSFRVSPSAVEISNIEFSDAVVVQEVSSVQGAKIPMTFSGGTLSFITERISNFRLRPPAFLKSGKLQFQIQFQDGRPLSTEKLPSFQVSATSDLSAPISSWTKLSPDLQPTGGLFTVNDPEAVGSARRFYRLVEGP